jgi:hypothetical protein
VKAEAFVERIGSPRGRLFLSRWGSKKSRAR